MHILSYLSLFIEDVVGAGLAEARMAVGEGGDTSRSGGKTAYGARILGLKVGAVGWKLDLSQNFREGVSGLCVREGKGRHRCWGFQRGECQEIATDLPILLPARCGHLTDLWQLEKVSCIGMCDLKIICNLKTSVLPWILTFSFFPWAVEWTLGQPRCDGANEDRARGAWENNSQKSFCP